MAKIKFDVSASDPEKATQSFEVPKPGVYTAVVKKLDVTKPQGKDRRIEAQYQITGPTHKGSVLFDYINLESEAAAWKLDQFLQAVGVASAKKRKGEFDTDAIQGKTIKVRVKNETYLKPGADESERRTTAKVAAMWAPTDEDEDVEEGDEDEFETDEDEEVEDEDSEEEAEAEEVDYSEWDLTDLKAEAKSRKISTKGLKKSQIISALEENDAEGGAAFDD